ncbi:ATP-binding cassette domain-containing protein [Micromonospora globbae]|uniref:ATP-binding cassette domain-containing protein n=1 Tax=Micromonospora globbae TaxID=1894969 RepID=A0A420F7E1_9ACTN|nr:ATP-binding cassette domain-containing protein [Micromonospora globbae]RKF28825.1 ATP-binding cassette domain-containing protein [Micromonospora globbae]
MSSAYAIEVDTLTKTFGRLKAVDGLSFTAEYGRVVGFIGPNGAGKTTTMRALVGHIRPDTGRAHVAGRPYRELTDPLGTVGAVLEAGAMHPGRSGRNHLRILARQGGIPARRVEEVIDGVGLGRAADRRVGGYSLGMRQRLALAAALLGDPAILMLDEPANGLDPEGIRWLREFLRGLAAEGRSVLVSSHGLAELALMVDEAVVVAHGRLVVQQPLAELRRLVGGRTVRISVPEPDRLAALLAERGHRVLGCAGDTVTVGGDDARAVGRVAFDHDIGVDRLLVEEPSLEEAYFRLTAGKESIR